MHIHSIRLQDFRGISGEVVLSHPLAILTGPNNSGKSTIIDALRLITFPYNETYNKFRPSLDDFSHDSLGGRISDTFSISLDLRGLCPADQGRLISCLTPEDSFSTARLTMVCTIVEEKIRTTFLGGNANSNTVEHFARTAIRSVYLPALRDAARDLRPGYSNKLVTLVSAFAPVGSTDREDIERHIADANRLVAEVDAVAGAQKAVLASLDALTGRGAFRHKSSLNLADAKYEKIVGALRALLGKESPLELDESGLGYSNILYMAVLLSVLERAEEAPLQLLLIEEPEAHLHPQLQTLLLKHMENRAVESSQVVMTTHSPNLASAAKVERVTAMAARGSGRVSSHLGSLEMTPKVSRYLSRFLDATKADLLFANQVILVEGIAEQVLLPQLALKLGVDFQAAGVSVINVGGLNFAYFSRLYETDGLANRCIIISDGDRAAENAESIGMPGSVSPEPDEDPSADVEGSISAYAQLLQDRATDNISVHLAQQTLEWDLAYVNHGNADGRKLLVDALTAIRPIVGARLSASNSEASDWATEFLKGVKGYKGDFAVALVDELANSSRSIIPPPYLAEAIGQIDEPNDDAEFASKDDGGESDDL